METSGGVVTWPLCKAHPIVRGARQAPGSAGYLPARADDRKTPSSLDLTHRRGVRIRKGDFYVVEPYGTAENKAALARYKPEACGELLNEGRELQEVSKEAVGNLSPLTRPIFVRDILRRFFRRVSLATPTSAPVRF